MSEKINQSADFILSKIGMAPEAAVILGSGLGGLVEALTDTTVIPYAEIPHFPVSTVKGHGSNLIHGKLNGRYILVMQGRFHFYEGYSMEQVIFPVRVMHKLKIKWLFISNASGGVNPAYKVGDLMVLDDHINFMGTNPLIGKNDDLIGPRFPDMSAPYDADLINKALSKAAKMGYRCHKGVYVAVTGPTFETRAEYKMIKILGGDCVGMSTVPEVIAARHAGMNVFAISVITDLGGNDHVEVITHEDVLKAAKEAGSSMTHIISDLVAGL